MKTNTIQNLVMGAVFLAYLGIFLVSPPICYITYIFAINGVFLTSPLYILVLIYGYLFGFLALMVWVIENRRSLERHAINRQSQRGK